MGSTGSAGIDDALRESRATRDLLGLDLPLFLLAPETQSQI